MSKYQINKNSSTSNRGSYYYRSNTNVYRELPIFTKSYGDNHEEYVVENNTHAVACNLGCGNYFPESVHNDLHEFKARATAAVDNFLDYCYKVMSRSDRHSKDVSMVLNKYSDLSEEYAAIESIRYWTKYSGLFLEPRRLFKCLPIMDLLLVFSSLEIKATSEYSIYTYRLFTEDLCSGKYRVVFHRDPNFNSCAYKDSGLQKVEFKFGSFRDNYVMDAYNFFLQYKKRTAVNAFSDVEFNYFSINRVAGNPTTWDFLNTKVSLPTDYYSSISSLPDSTLTMKNYLEKNNLNTKGVDLGRIFFSIITNNQHVTTSFYNKRVDAPLNERKVFPISCKRSIDVYLVDNNNTINISELSGLNLEVYKNIVAKLDTIRSYLPLELYPYSYYTEDNCKKPVFVNAVRVKSCYLVYTGRKLKYSNKYTNPSYNDSVFNLDDSYKNIKRVEKFLDSIISELEERGILGYNHDFILNNLPVFPTCDLDLLNLDNNKDAAKYINAPQLGGITTCMSTLLRSKYLGMFKDSLVSLTTLRSLYFPTKGALIQSMLHKLGVHGDYEELTTNLLNTRQRYNLYVPDVGYIDEFLKKYRHSKEQVSLLFLARVYKLYFSIYNLFTAPLMRKSTASAYLFMCKNTELADYHNRVKPKEYENVYPLYLISRMEIDSMYYKALEKRLSDNSITLRTIV